MSSPLLVTKAEVEDINRALIDLAGKGGSAGVSPYVDTAQNLAYANPVLAKGQLGWESDTLSGKIGDGSTPYNSLTYFYRGLPVSGEPSLGTPHFREKQVTTTLLSQVAVSGTWYTVTFTVPSGTKAIIIPCDFSSAIASRMVWRPYNNGDTVAQSFARLITACQGTLSGAPALVTVDSSGRVDFGCDLTGSTMKIWDWSFYYT